MPSVNCQNPENFPIQDWADEIRSFLCHSHSLCLAVFTQDGALLFANPAMLALFRGAPVDSIINPAFATFWQRPFLSGSLVYEGYITIGDYRSSNPSLRSKVFRKNDLLLISCDYDASELFEQNKSLADLNQQVNNLQRQLIREKACLQNTLSELHAANEKLAELNATKDRFFSIIAHDLRSPFNAIVGISSLLAEQIRQQDYDGIDEYAGIIEESSQRALALLLNLLEWARSQTGRIPFRPSDIPLQKLLADAIATVQHAARQKKIDIRCDAPENAGIYADPEMLATVLRNLLSNAVKFTRPGGQITLSAKSTDLGWAIAVRDNGVGISPENQAKLFRIDVSPSTAGTQDEQGTGLGLILCKEFVEKHGGQLHVESTPGQGSTFSFNIPQQNAET